MNELPRPLAGGRGLFVPVILLVGLVSLVTLGPFLWRTDPLKTNLAQRLQPPGLEHPMGTDGSGRDVFARFLAGSAVSLTSGVVAVVLSGSLGILLGLIAGLRRGILDSMLSRVFDVLLAFPQLLLGMAVSIGLGPGTPSAVIGISIACLPVYARLARSECIQILTLPYIDAARTLGLSTVTISLRHVLPAMAPTLLVQSAAVFANTVISLGALGFVGLGAQAPTPEWGSMIADGMSYVVSGGWWVSLGPGLGLFLTVSLANWLCDKGSVRIARQGAHA